MKKKDFRDKKNIRERKKDFREEKKILGRKKIFAKKNEKKNVKCKM